MCTNVSSNIFISSFCCCGCVSHRVLRQANLGARGRAEEEVRALFERYDLDGNRMLDATEQKLLENDLKVGLICTNNTCIVFVLNVCLVYFGCLDVSQNLWMTWADIGVLW